MFMLHNNSEDRNSYPLQGSSLKSRTVLAKWRCIAGNGYFIYCTWVPLKIVNKAAENHMVAPVTYCLGTQGTKLYAGKHKLHSSVVNILIYIILYYEGLSVHSQVRQPEYWECVLFFSLSRQHPIKYHNHFLSHPFQLIIHNHLPISC
jgi:hypothetical protein